MVRLLIAKAKEAGDEIPDHETLCESILYQYAYLEQLLAVCDKEKNPKSEVARLIRNKDPKHNKDLTDAREAVDRLIQMADDATATNKEANDEPPPDSKPYDKKYYGQLGDIKEFKQKGVRMTTKILEKSGGKYATMDRQNNVFWKPKSKVFTKEFVKKFPQIVMPP